MLNITFTGNVFLESGAPAQDVRYQGLFIKVNPNSSDSIWDVLRLSETNQYNFNLGDNTWLSQQAGYAAPGDKVLLCFWTPNTKSRDELGLTEWAFIEWILDERDVYVQNVQLRSGNAPNCLFDITENTVGNAVTVEDVGTNSDFTWTYAGKEHHQAHLWNDYHIFDMNMLSVPISINWGDGNTLTYPLSASPFSHIYGVSGDYDITVSVVNASGLGCQASFDTIVAYEVFNGLDWNDPSTMGSPTTYMPSISGDLSRIQGVNYYIDGVLTHVDFAYNTDFQHTFTTPGNHIIKQCIKFNDGFENRVQCKDFTVHLDTVADYVSSDYDCGLVFTDTSIIGAPPIVKYQWDVTDGPFILAHVEGAAYSDWYYSWPYKGTFRVRLAVTDSNGLVSSITKEYVVDTCIGTTDQSAGGGMSGGGSPWVYAETKYIKTNDPLPIINIICVDDCDVVDKDKRILILEIIE